MQAKHRTTTLHPNLTPNPPTLHALVYLTIATWYPTDRTIKMNKPGVNWVLTYWLSQSRKYSAKRICSELVSCRVSEF
jgi:hypothetical protein